jgi:hypothetical protein
VIMTDRTKQGGNFDHNGHGNLLGGKGYCMHGSPQNGWTNEMFGDFHAESVKYDSWRLHVHGPDGSQWWY